ncbi:hypothetical protein EKN56_02295 [Limnobaculum zhutongyuii]|uniref:Sel1 repeat family protein n=1 Tax=Limnobaculum zhutongyuii TaxID=2498113 RepID=A0A411WGJ4_9GAMM|nr:SEL1-like repeat protein [Limnobaculum zhutongyuii]QBH95333.1 hypothetical protein EKN56_02295 [Limnobaculum zhutongyuii]TQS89049.1 hypothetical protein ELQ32_07605 [Limnobaculum zhutongyuii]
MTEMLNTKKFLLCSLLLASMLSNAVASDKKSIKFISQIEDISVGRGVMTFVDNDVKLIAAEKITFRTESPCGESTIAVNAKSLGMKDEVYVSHLTNIAQAAKNDEYYEITIGSCDRAKRSQKRQFITKIRPCTSAICGKKYITNKNIIWLDESFDRTVKRNASFFMEKPFIFDKQNNIWKMTGWYVDKDKTQNGISSNNAKKIKAFEGYTNTKDFSSLQFVSKFTVYYPSGTIKSQNNFDSEGKLDGETKNYFADGKLYQIAIYKNGKVDGVVSTYHENGNIESKMRFHQGVAADGQCNHYGPDGQLEREHAYLNGKYDGKYVDYFPDGKIETESFYAGGKLVGESKAYYQSGQLRSISRNNEEGYRDGKQQNFNEEGTLITESIYKDSFNLSHKSWYDNGNRREQEQWRQTSEGESEKYGDFKTWYENGKLKSETSYSKGLAVSNQEWYEDGNKNFLSEYKDGEIDGVLKEWDRVTGKLIKEEHYAKGKQHGSSKRWDAETGNLIKEENYQNGEYHGAYKKYDAKTGKIREERSYLDGKFDGPWNQWDEETNHLVSESFFKQGKRQGIQKGYDKTTGELANEVLYADDRPVNGLQTGKNYKDGKLTSYDCYADGFRKASLNEPDDIESRAQNSDATAQTLLGQFYFECGYYDESRKVLNHPIIQLRPEALYLQARMYMLGKGEPLDRQKSIDLMFKAAEGGYVLAQKQVGLLYIPADGRMLDKKIPRDIKSNATLARKWILAAAEQNDVESLYVLGVMSETGVGVKKNLRQALEYYDQAAEAGFNRAYVRSVKIREDAKVKSKK